MAIFPRQSGWVSEETLCTSDRCRATGGPALTRGCLPGHWHQGRAGASLGEPPSAPPRQCRRSHPGSSQARWEASVKPNVNIILQVLNIQGHVLLYTATILSGVLAIFRWRYHSFCNFCHDMRAWGPPAPTRGQDGCYGSLLWPMLAVVHNCGPYQLWLIAVTHMCYSLQLWSTPAMVCLQNRLTMLQTAAVAPGHGP